MIDVISWNGYSLNTAVYETCIESLLYDNAPVQAQMVERHGRYPLVGGVSRPADMIMLKTVIRPTTAASRAALRTIFETESGDIKTLIVNGDEGEEQFVRAVCEAHYEDDEFGNALMTVLRVHDDTSWRSTAVETDTETVIADAQEWEIVNDGDQIARPVITITPRDVNADINPYRRFMAVTWRGEAAERYPTDIAGNALDTQIASTDFAQADGDDIRVLVNGVLVDHWLDDPDTDNTSIWVNLDWQKYIPLTLRTAIAATGTVETIDVNEDIDLMPSSGILLIDSEVFLYTGKNNGLKRFAVLARAAHGTSMAAHIVDEDVFWIQHAIEITYGNASLPALVTNDGNKPMIELATSTNLAFDYDSFGKHFQIAPTGQQGVRTWQWRRPPQGLHPIIELAWLYTGYSDSQFAGYPDGNPYSTNPWAVAGTFRRSGALIPSLAWELYCPCGIASWNFANGYKRANDSVAAWDARVLSYQLAGGGSGGGDDSFFIEYTIPAPGSPDAWEAWSRSQSAVGTDIYYLRLRLLPNSTNTTGVFVEISDATVTFDSDLTPVATICAQVGNYTVDARLTHVESGRALDINYAMAIDTSLEIDTDAGSVTFLGDGSSQFQAVRRHPRPRVEWLPLQPGTNTLRWEEEGVAEVDVTVDWRERRGA